MPSQATMTAARLAAESLMVDTFTAYKPSKQTVDGLKVTVYAAQGTTPGKTQGTSAVGKDSVSRTVSIGGADLTVRDGGLQIPLAAFVGTDGLAIVASEHRGVAWEFECTAVGPVSDPAMLGQRYMVVNCPTKSMATARRMDVVEVPKP